MSYIDTYELATGGQNLTNTFTLASNGILVDIYITDLPDIIIPPLYDDSGSGIITPETVIKRKKITVVATIDGTEYKREIVVEDQPSITVKNVDVDVQMNNTTPDIKITIKI